MRSPRGSYRELGDDTGAIAAAMVTGQARLLERRRLRAGGAARRQFPAFLRRSRGARGRLRGAWSDRLAAPGNPFERRARARGDLARKNRRPSIARTLGRPLCDALRDIRDGLFHGESQRAWREPSCQKPIIGLAGAANVDGFDLAVAPTGEAAALRLPSGELALLGRKPQSFVGEQWLRADADARAPADAKSGVACDDLGCVGRAIDGRLVALVEDRSALIDDCGRAAIVITPRSAPEGCGAPIVIDRRKLAETGAVTLRLKGDRVEWNMVRSPDEDRPWSRAPMKRKTRAAWSDSAAQEREEDALSEASD
jgi:hypothetical protein